MRESCIQHQSGQPIAIVRGDYKEITGSAVRAAILNVFEYWANGAIANNPNLINAAQIPVGARTVEDIREMLLGLASEKCVRNHLKALIESEFISVSTTKGFLKTQSFLFNTAKIQAAIDGLPSGKSTASNGKSTVASGKSTVGANGTFTGHPYIEVFKKNSLKEGSEHEDFDLTESEQHSTLEDSTQSEPPTPGFTTTVTVQSIESTASIETSDRIENSAAARFETRMKSRNPHPDLVQAGLGDLWVGPKRGDFDPYLVKATQAHLRKHDRPSERGDAITSIANMIRACDWTKLEQRAEEGKALKASAERVSASAPAPSVPASKPDRLQAQAGVARMKAIIGARNAS